MLKRPTRGRDRCSADEEIITFNGWSFVLRQIVAKNVSKELQPPPHIYEKKWRAITHSWISPLGAFSRLAHCRQSKMAHNFECNMSFEIAINRSKDLRKLYARLFVMLLLLSNVAYFDQNIGGKNSENEETFHFPGPEICPHAFLFCCMLVSKQQGWQCFSKFRRHIDFDPCMCTL